MKRTALFFAAALSLIIALAGTVNAEGVSMRIEGEWCTDSNLTPQTENANYSGIPVSADADYSSGMALLANLNEDMPTDGIYFSYTIDVPLGGYYDMNFAATLPDSEASSVYSIQINNDAKFKLNSSSCSKTGDGVYGSGLFITRIYLESGENIVKFVVEAPASNGTLIFGLDYFELTYADYQGPWVEAEFFEAAADGQWSIGADTAQGSQISRGQFIVFNKNDTGILPWERLVVYAAEDGEYNLEAVSTVIAEYTGNWSITNEEGDVINIDAANISGGDIIAGFGNVMRRYTANDTLYLHKGVNRLTLNFQKTSGGAGNNYNTYIDRIGFEKTAEKASGAATTITIEGESAKELGYWKIEGDAVVLSEGMTSDPNRTNWAGVIIGDEFRLDYNFTVNADAYYDMLGYMTCANGTQMMFSPMEFKIDDNSWVEFTVKNYFFVDYYNGTTDIAYQRAIYKYNTPLYLTQGEHTLSVRIREKRSNNYTTDWYYNQLDKFELVPKLDIGGMSVQISSPVMRKGANASIFVSAFDDAGQKMEDAALDIEYYTADSRIAAVDETGTITALNPGRTTVTVVGADTAGGKSFSIEKEVEVVSDTAGIRLLDAKMSGDKLLVTLSDIGSSLDEIELAACVGAQKNGIDTSYSKVIFKNIKLKNTGAVTKDELHGIMPTTVEVEIGELAAGEKITLLVWDSSNNMLPILMNTEVTK